PTRSGSASTSSSSTRSCSTSTRAWRSPAAGSSAVEPRCRSARRIEAALPPVWSERLEEFDQIALLRAGEPQAERLIVVVHHVTQGCEAAVVVEAALRAREQALERRRAIAAVGGTAGL